MGSRTPSTRAAPTSELVNSTGEHSPHMHLLRPRLALGPLALVAALALAACGGSNSDNNDGGGTTAKKGGSSSQAPASGENAGGANVSASQGQQKGGTLKV